MNRKGRKQKTNPLKSGASFFQISVSAFDSSRDFLRSFCSNSIKKAFPRLWRRSFGILESLSNQTIDETVQKVRDKSLVPKDVLAREGEDLVCRFVQQLEDVEIVARNFENYYCEIDLIYLDKRFRQIVFVEVKTRRQESRRFSAFYSVNAKRRKKLALAARRFVEERGFLEYERRYDVVVVIASLNRKPTMKYHRAAFGEEYALNGYLKTDYGKTRNTSPSQSSLRERVLKKFSKGM